MAFLGVLPGLSSFSPASFSPASFGMGPEPVEEAPLGLWWLAAQATTPLPRAEAERRFAAVLAAAGEAIWRLCRFREKDADLRRDLYQEIALSLWQALPGFRGEASERTWALRIAHNIAASHVGRAVRRRGVSLDGLDEQALESASAAVPAPEPERRWELLARLAALDVPSQQLVLLHLEGLSTQEIADVTGLSPTNVTTRLNRLRQRLSGTAAEAHPDAAAVHPAVAEPSAAAEHARGAQL